MKIIGILAIVVLTLCAIKRFKDSYEEDKEKLAAELAGLSLKIAAIFIAALMSVSPLNDLMGELESFSEKTPDSWKIEDYAEDYEYYYNGSQLDKSEYDQMKRDVIADFIYEELKILVLCIVITALGTIIQKRALSNYELKKIHEAMAQNNRTVINTGAKTPAFCSDCGSKIPAGSSFCPGCGKKCVAEASPKSAPRIYASQPKPKENPVGEWRCGSCDTKNPKTAIMCKSCGKYR